MELKINNLTKLYDSNGGIKNITFKLKQGECLGLIGHNGAGKTTLLRLLATLLRPNRGNIIFNNKDITTDEINYRKLIGYMPEDAGLYKKETAFSNLYFYSRFYDDISEDDIKNKLKEYELSTSKKVGSFSKGMKQKVLFIKAILNNPKLLLLDEPLSGLDPGMRIMVKDKLKKYQKQGTSIIISTHILSEIYEICDRFVIMKNGEIKSDVYKTELSNQTELEENYKVIMK